MNEDDCDLTPDVESAAQPEPVNCDKCGAPLCCDGEVEGFGMVTAQEAVQRLAIMAKIEPENTLALLLRVVEKMTARDISKTLQGINSDLKMNEKAQSYRLSRMAKVFPSLAVELKSYGWINRKPRA